MRVIVKQQNLYLLTGAAMLLSAYSVLAAPDVGKVIHNQDNNVVSLCSKGHHIYFTCQTKNKKIISLCGSGKLERPKFIYYRFGKTDKIEIEFPAKKDETSYRKFGYNDYYRYQVNYFGVTFKNGDYKYFIYHNYVGDDPSKEPETYFGINVGKVDEPDYQINIPCTSGIKANLYPLISFLPCDEEVKEIGCNR
jgi:hypothetical protein